MNNRGNFGHKGRNSSWQGRGNYGRKFGQGRDQTPGPDNRNRSPFNDGRGGKGPTGVSVVDARIAPAGEPGNDNYQVILDLKVQGTLVEGCLADTGSCRTILSRRIFQGLAEKAEMEKWPRTERLHGLGGGELAPMGTAVCPLDLGPHVLYHPVVVTGGMDYPIILGVDVLRHHGVQITRTSESPPRCGGAMRAVQGIRP